MQDDPSEGNALSKPRAAELMAELVRIETGANVSPAVILKLFEMRWRTLSILAHAIHKAEPLTTR